MTTNQKPKAKTCNHAIPDPSCDVCGLNAIARNHYFDGKLLTARHFEIEQDAWRGSQRRHNHYLHGVGTVCGLKISEHPDPSCRYRYVVLEPGLALDCCGHEIVVTERKVIDVQTKLKAALADKGTSAAQLQPGDRLTVRIGLVYREAGIEPVPALLDDCDTGSAEECDLIVERYDVDVSVAINEVPQPTGTILDPTLTWAQTLSIDTPQASVVDRAMKRLYVADTDDNGGYIRVYDTDTHRLIARATILSAEAGSGGITGLALSRGGSRLYVALPASGDGGASVLVLDRQALESTSEANPLPDPLPRVTIPDGQVIVRLDASVGDDALLVLTADDASGGTPFLRRWSSAQINQVLDGSAPDPAPDSRDLTDRLAQVQPAAAAPTAVDMAQSLDGRWLVLADGANGRLVIISLPGFDNAGAAPADFISAFDLPTDRQPSAVEISYDGQYVYALAPAAGDGAHLLRIRVDDANLSSYLPLPAQYERWADLPITLGGDENLLAPEALDVVVTPRDNFAYVLRRALDEDASPRRGDVLIVDVDRMSNGFVDPNDAENFKQTVRLGAPLDDSVLFETLAPLGSRLYVATVSDVGGMIRVYDIDEAACDTFFKNTVLDGCDDCDTSSPVTIATLDNYIIDAPMVEVLSSSQQANPQNLIDNFSERELVPSATTLRQVIECMLDKGFVEGIPGPRGQDGKPGTPGAPGARGASIGKVTVTTDPNITEPVVDGLFPIPGDPNGDLELRLRMPEMGGASPPKLNRVVAANFIHDELMNRNQFVKRFSNATNRELSGILILFEKEVLAQTLTNRTAYAEIYGEFNERPVQPLMLLPLATVPVHFTPETEGWDVFMLNGYHIEAGNADPLHLPEDLKPEFGIDVPVNGVLLTPVDGGMAAEMSAFFGDIVNTFGALEPVPSRFEGFPADNRIGGLVQVTVTLRGDQIIDTEGLPLDGNHLFNPPPSKAPSGNGTPGGDWVAFLHLLRD